MAIKPVGYTGAGWNYGGQTYKPYIPPKPAPITVAPAVGYTGAGWNYGGETYKVPGAYTMPSVRTSPLPSGTAQGQGQGGGVTQGDGGDETITTVRTPMQVYESDILGDPMSRAAQQTYDVGVQGLANQRRDQIRQAIIAAGYTPSLTGSLSEYAGDVDQGTLDAAAANQLSARAQLNKALNQANYDLPYILAASGMGRSGSFATGTTALQEQYQQNAQQGLDALNRSLLGYGSTYAQGVDRAMQALNASRAAVAQRLAQQAGFSETVTRRGGGGGGGTTDTGDAGVEPTQPQEGWSDFGLGGGYIPPPTVAPPAYKGTGAGGFTGSITAPAVVKAINHVRKKK